MPYHEKNISTKCLGSGSCFVNFHPKNPLVIISELPTYTSKSYRCTVWAIMTVAAIQSQGQDQMTIVVTPLPCWTIWLWTSSGQHSSRLTLVSDRPWTHWLSWCLGTIQFLSIPSIIIPSPFTSLRGVTLSLSACLHDNIVGCFYDMILLPSTMLWLKMLPQQPQWPLLLEGMTFTL